MKLDPELRLQILEKVGIYSNRFSISEPRMLLTTKEVLDMPREMTEGRRTSAYKYYVYLIFNTILFLSMLEKSLMKKLWRIRLFMN